jgi:DNA-binding GntR family transcriptional regulator
MLPHADDAKTVPLQGVVDVLVHTITERILDGRYPPGFRLVEAELMRDLQAGRNSVREALRRLQASRLITVEYNRGAVVANPGPEEILSAMEVREVVFGLAARAAARRHHLEPGRIPALLARLEQELATGTPADHPARNTEFHNEIHDLSGNPNVGPLMEQFRLPTLHTIYFRTLDDASFRQSVIEHCQICRTIIRGDAEGAEHLARLHERSKTEIALGIAASAARATPRMRAS